MREKYALVTGGSSGIGYSLAQLLACDGYQIFLAALGDEKLVEAQKELEGDYGVEVLPIAVDLREREAPFQIYQQTEGSGYALDVLINCAGFGTYGGFEQLEPKRDYDLVLVNCGALIALTRLIYPQMLERGSGRILNMSSTVGLQPTPYMAVYSASKAFVSTFSLSLSFEARKTGGAVSVTTVYPYATRTRFAEAANMVGHRLFNNIFTLEPEKVAAAAYRAMLAGRERLVLPRIGSLVFDGLYRLMPIRSRMALVKWGMRT
ncbi:MAG: SDR family oxidoreductase [Anaerolineales bacterium]|nr:SDR family oxidoreductase [Anaerolineales bacterium]